MPKVQNKNEAVETIFPFSIFRSFIICRRTISIFYSYISLIHTPCKSMSLDVPPGVSFKEPLSHVSVNVKDLNSHP